MTRTRTIEIEIPLEPPELEAGWRVLGYLVARASSSKWHDGPESLNESVEIWLKIYGAATLTCYAGTNFDEGGFAGNQQIWTWNEREAAWVARKQKKGG